MDNNWSVRFWESKVSSVVIVVMVLVAISANWQGFIRNYGGVIVFAVGIYLIMLHMDKKMDTKSMDIEKYGLLFFKKAVLVSLVFYVMFPDLTDVVGLTDRDEYDQIQATFSPSEKSATDRIYGKSADGDASWEKAIKTEKDKRLPSTHWLFTASGLLPLLSVFVFYLSFLFLCKRAVGTTTSKE